MAKIVDPIVTIKDGTLLGTLKTDVNGKTFFSFQGIPYAKPPVGKLRFKAPQLPEKWEGIRNAQEEMDECYGRSFSGYVGSEDCLFLNVFTQEILSDRLKPVMVWIHGGGFTSGSSKTDLYGPEILMTEDIVLVTFNYRLGPLGFLVLEDSSLAVPGNAGLKDMVMVLKWVQSNISQFCGDPKNVTIFGESAGGAAVNFLMLSPMSKGLFHKAIAQSGSALNGWTAGKRHGAYLLAEALGISTNNEALLLKQLQEIPVEELMKGSEKVPDPFFIGKFRPFVPVIEKPSQEPAFLSENPLDIIKSGRYNKVPMITGCCSREGIFIYALCQLSRRDPLLRDETIVPHDMHLRQTTEAYEFIKKEILDYYFKGKDPLQNIDDIYKLYTDNYFLLHIYNGAKYHLESGTSPIFFYHFSLDTELNFLKKLYGIEDPGACHADDLAYLFKNMFVPDLTQLNHHEKIAIQRLVKLWTNFAKYGNPTPKESDDLLQVNWEPISKEKFNVMDIGKELCLLDAHPQKEAIDFWNNLYKKKYITSKL